jgi:hypothetical protein
MCPNRFLDIDNLLLVFDRKKGRCNMGRVELFSLAFGSLAVVGILLASRS